MLRRISAMGDGNTMARKVAASDVPDFEELECVIRPPDPDAEPIVIKCSPDQSELTPTKIPLPTHSDNWSGTIYGQTTVKGPAGTFHFTQAIYYKSPERADGTASKAHRSAKPDVPKRMYLSRSREGAKLEVDGVAFPPPERSLGGWTSNKGEWLLFGNPAALIGRDSSGSPWAVSR